MQLIEQNVADAPRVSLTKTGKVSMAKRGVKVHVCAWNNCGKTFSRAEHLRRHQISHDETFQLICPYPGCGRPFYRDDLFKKHQKRHDEPNNRLSSMTNIPGYSIVPIRITKQQSDSSATTSVNDSPESRRSSTDTDVSQDDGSDSGGDEGLSLFRDELSNYTSVLELETFGGDEDTHESLIVFQELGRLKPRIALHMLDVQRSVGWNVDPFMKMPKFKDRCVNTTEIYHHCLKVLGRVGKSPEWVERIIEDRMGFLSSLVIASAHMDMLRGEETESPATIACKYEVLQMLRDSTMVGHSKTSDLTFMAITQFLSCEGLYGGADVVRTHIRGLECIAKLRGGLKALGWSNELAIIAGGKIMILSVSYDFECSPMWLEAECIADPHFPAMCHNTPESPAYYQNKDLAHLKGAKHCCNAVYEMLLDMRWLTDRFMDAFVHEKNMGSTEAIRRKVDFQTHAAALLARLSSRPYQPSNSYYEIVRMVSLVYTTALQHCIPFSAAAAMMGTSIPETIADHLLQTDLISCWYGDMSGVLFWCSLVAAATSAPLKTTSGKRAARWLRIGAMYSMILLSTVHAKVFTETAKNVIAIQRVLRLGDATAGSDV